MHYALDDVNLDFFILSSSLSGVIGRAGQANYAAASTFLQAFSQYRHGLKLPCSVIDIGVMENTTHVDRQNEKRPFKATGLGSPTEQDLFDAIEISINNSSPFKAQNELQNTIIAPAQLAIGMCSSDVGIAPPWVHDIRMSLHRPTTALNASAFAKSNRGLQSFLNDVAQDPMKLKEGGSLQFITIEIGRMIYSVLLLEESEIDIFRPLAQLGMDSLVRIEIRGWWRKHLGVDINVIDILKHESIATLGRTAVSQLYGKFSAASSQPL